MSRVEFGPKFENELQVLEKWYNMLGEEERTATIYLLVQQATQAQISFLSEALQCRIILEPSYQPKPTSSGEQGENPIQELSKSHS